MEHDIDVDAYSGAITKHEQDYEDDYVDYDDRYDYDD